jgi:TrmH family RNA methyltransferase
VAGGVDPYNGKTVRATAGSLFHLPVVDASLDELLVRSEQAGLTTLATAAAGAVDLTELADSATLTEPVVWLFGSEAHGLPSSALAAADHTVRIPIYGRAESLNLATSAAICLYATALARRTR